MKRLFSKGTRQMEVSLDGICSSSLERLVALEPLDSGSAAVFIRDGDSVSRREIPFRPFLLLSSPALLNGMGGEFEVKRLEGDAPFAFLASFPDSFQYEAALKRLKESTGMTSSSPNAPYKAFGDLCQQALVALKARLFRGMGFPELRRMQFDIETLVTPPYEFPNAAREGDAIFLISLSDSTGWEKSLSIEGRTEKELLQDFVNCVRERDPDVLEGHNVFRFDLPYIEARAKRHKVKLVLGRDGSTFSKRNSRFSAAERTVNYTRYEVFGRHMVDTLHLVQLYDVSHRDLDGYGLKSVARHFGVASPDRVYIEGAEIAKAWEADKAKVAAYSLDDVREARAISALLSPSFFYQAQIVPLSYQNCVVRGNATRIDALLVASYLDKGHSVPVPEQGRAFAGALTKAFHSGVFDNVWHCDVRSLYPSIILAGGWSPSRDPLGVFKSHLKTLRDFRLFAKDARKSAATQERRDYFDSLQATFKILINSFYGYLGFEQGSFNDYAMAEGVTAKGREILSSMLAFLEGAGAKVIEMDTDGIYFQPPQGSTTDSLEKALQAKLPDGIDIELDATYKAMFCYKSKNYALLKEGGEVAITGAALKSRGLEPFQRDYMEEAIAILLRKDFAALEALSERYRKAIAGRSLPLHSLAKSENLADSLDTYRRKMSSGEGRRSAAYELALRSGRDYRQGDQVSFYITGLKKKVSVVDNSRLLSDAPAQRDENVEYYLDKLEELRKKFSVFSSGEEPAPSPENSLGLVFDEPESET